MTSIAHFYNWCDFCKHRIDSKTCKAYPDEMPENDYGQFLHFEKFPNQQGDYVCEVIDEPIEAAFEKIKDKYAFLENFQRPNEPYYPLEQFKTEYGWYKDIQEEDLKMNEKLKKLYLKKLEHFEIAFNNMLDDDMKFIDDSYKKPEPFTDEELEILKNTSEEEWQKIKDDIISYDTCIDENGKLFTHITYRSDKELKKGENRGDILSKEEINYLQNLTEGDIKKLQGEIKNKIIKINDKDYEYIRVTHPDYPNRFMDYYIYNLEYPIRIVDKLLWNNKKGWRAAPMFFEVDNIIANDKDELFKIAQEKAIDFFKSNKQCIAYKRYLESNRTENKIMDVQGGKTYEVYFIRVYSSKDPDSYVDFRITQWGSGEWNVIATLLDKGFTFAETLENAIEGVKLRGVDYIDYTDNEDILAYKKFLLLCERETLNKEDKN